MKSGSKALSRAGLALGLSCIAAAWSSSALALDPGGLSLASGASPYAAGCHDATQSGTLFTNSEVEPYVAVNPRDPFNLIGVWQQDRWSNGGARGLVTGVSFNAGLSWIKRTPRFTRCAGGNAANGGDYERASDPWVSFAPNGTAHQIAISLNGLPFAPGSNNAVLVSRSRTGGLDWSNPITLIRDDETAFNDKETITADPTDSRFVYAVWDRLSAAGGPTMFARTTDGGRTWEAARVIYDPGVTNQTIGNEIVVLPSGVLVNLFTEIDVAADGSVTSFLGVIRSTDKGSTWSAPLRVADLFAVGTVDPDTGTPIRDSAILAQMTAAPNGDLYVTWQDARFTDGTHDAIALARSTDGGMTWSAPVQVNPDATVPAFVPSLTVRHDGTVGVSYYDFRSNTSDPATLPTSAWLAFSRNQGTTWRERPLTRPFDLSIAPNAGGLFLGDYQGLSSIGPVFLPFFAKTSDGDLANRTDIYSTLSLALLGTKAEQADARRRIETEEAKLPERFSAAAPLAAPSSGLRARAANTVVRTMEQRVPGWARLRGLAPAAPPAR